LVKQFSQKFIYTLEEENPYSNAIIHKRNRGDTQAHIRTHTHCDQELERKTRNRKNEKLRKIERI